MLGCVFIEMKDLVNDCLFFKSKEPFFIALGVWAWVNLIGLLITFYLLINAA